MGKGGTNGAVAIKFDAAGQPAASTAMNALNDPQVVLLGALGLGLLGLLIMLLRKAGGLCYSPAAEVSSFLS